MVDSISKGQLEKEEKKLKRKVQQAISTVCRAEESTFENLVTKQITGNMLVTHFGNGDEDDQSLVLNYAQQFGRVAEITILPGINYGHIRFENTESAKLLLDSLTHRAEEMLGARTFSNNKTLVYFNTVLQAKDLKRQQTIDFPTAVKAKTGIIPGLHIFEDFVTIEEEQNLIKSLDSLNWTKLLNRKVQHFGFEFKYGTNDVDPDQNLGVFPDFVDFVKPRMESVLRDFKRGDQNVLEKFGYFDQLTCNDYLPGQGIPPHVDTHSPFQEVFAAISLKSGTVMHFKNPQNQTIDIYIEPRSLMVFSGEARYNWLHSIAQRKVDKVEGLLKFRHRRVSLTFRKIKTDPCKCDYPALCDSQNKSVAVKENQLSGESEEAKVLQSDSTKATDMERLHVYDVYEKIAPHFSNTRYKPWPKIAQFLNNLQDGSIVADVGCGNGKYLGVNSKIQMIGTDRSFNLIGCAKQRNESFQTFVADSLQLPMRSDSVDSVISIAVVHHFSTESLRVQALSEMLRILKVGGRVLVLVWAYEQEHKKFVTQDVFVPWHLQDTYDGTEKVVESKPEQSDFIHTGVKDKDKQATVYHRYYHVFMENELETLITKHFQNKLKIVDRFYDHANWVCVCEKI